MPEIYPSCAETEAQLHAFNQANDHRLTVIAGLYAPATGQLALVQTLKSAREESLELGLKPPQGGIESGENIAAAFLRELEEEAGVYPSQLRAVIGLPIEPVMTGGRARDDKKAKAFGALCGIVDGQPPQLTADKKEVARASWCNIDVADRIFRTQADIRRTGKRGIRSLRVLQAITEIDLQNLR